MTQRFGSGAGPGVITPDGCAVDLYRLLPPGESEAQLIARVVPPGGTVLELGSGSGRVTQCLVQRGFAVVAVDESADMLAAITYTPTVLSTIEDLDLPTRFDAVILGSHLLNTPARADAAAMLSTCANHLSDDGVVIIERHAPDWFGHASESMTEVAGITYGLVDVRRDGPDLLSATALYRVGDREWRHAFTARRVDDGDLQELAREAGLTVEAFLDERRSWVVLRRADPAVGD